MNTILSKSLYYYFKRSQFLSGLSKAIFEYSQVNERNTYFNNSLSQYTEPGNYTVLLQESLKLTPIQTNIPIRGDVLGGNTQSTLTRYGKPDFILHENELKIFLYARQFNDLKIRCEIHFYNDEIFSVRYVYRVLDAEDKAHIIKTIAAKYVCRELDEKSMCNSKIIDKNDDIIFFDELTAGLVITYLSNSESDWFRGMTGEVNAQKDSSKFQRSNMTVYSNCPDENQH